eukprot:1156492-Pelagomonas_calceolata.AAC.11
MLVKSNRKWPSCSASTYYAAASRPNELLCPGPAARHTHRRSRSVEGPAGLCPCLYFGVSKLLARQRTRSMCVLGNVLEKVRLKV